MKDHHRFIVITPGAINALGIAMTVPVPTGGEGARRSGLTVAILGHRTTGFAVCNQVRSFDIEARVQAKTASYVESLDAATTDEIVAKVTSIIDPAP